MSISAFPMPFIFFYNEKVIWIYLWTKIDAGAQVVKSLPSKPADSGSNASIIHGCIWYIISIGFCKPE